MPMSVFPITTGKNVRLRYEPTRHRSTVMTTKIRLKNVSAFERMISPADFPPVSLCLIGKALRAQSLCLLGAQAAKGRGVLRLR